MKLALFLFPSQEGLDDIRRSWYNAGMRQQQLTAIATSPVTIIVILFALAFGSLQGCSLKAKQTRQAAAVVNAKANIGANSEATVDKARGQVFATGLALDAATNREPATALAKDFNSRAQLTLGAPAYQDATDYRDIVSGLLATNEQTQAEARRALAAKDSAITALQAEATALKSKLSEAEARRDAGYAKAAVQADKWARLMRWVKLAGIALASAFILPIALKVSALLFPAMAPIASIVDSIFGGIARGIFRAVPGAAEKAKVVAEDSYNKTYEALADLVLAIQEAKADPVVSARLKPILLDKTDMTTRPVITEVKQDLGLK